MRCALYTRCSTEDQDVRNQLYQLREFASRQNWQVVHEFSDAGISGKRGDRPAFKEMFAAASKRQFDVLLFWSLDRLTREGVLPTLTYLNRLTAYGVGWRSFQELYIDSLGPFGDAVIAILSSIAKQERVRLSERTKAGLARVRAKGTRLGRPIGSGIAIDLHAIRERMKQGESVRSIARTLGVSHALIIKRIATA